MKAFATLLVSAGLGVFAAAPSSAMPVTNLGTELDNNVEHARVVCNRWGRCFSTHRRYYGPRYGYYGYGGPRYYGGYGYRPYYGYAPYGYGYGRPGFGFSFRF